MASNHFRNWILDQRHLGKDRPKESFYRDSAGRKSSGRKPEASSQRLQSKAGPEALPVFESGSDGNVPLGFRRNHFTQKLRRAEAMQTETYTREFAFDRAKINNDKREIELSFSSEQAVERSFGYEVLSHDPGAVDFSRLESGPLLWNHDTDQFIGRVTNPRVSGDKKARALVTFGNSQRAKDVWADVQQGLISTVSVGYRILKMEKDGERDGETQYKATKWQPYEVSIVPVPADTSVGIGRSSASQHRRIEVMTNPKEEVRIEIDAIADRLENKVPGIREMASRAILAGTSVEEFRAQAMQALPSMQPIQGARPLEGVKERDWEKYSITKAIRGHLEGNKFDGMEREFSDELAMRGGMKPQGFFVPQEAWAAGRRNFVAGTGTLGGNIVETSNLGDQFIELLRNRAQVINLGARVITLDNPVTIPRQSGAGATNWVGETVAATLSTGNFTQISLVPHAVTGFQQYSKQLLVTGNPSIDMLVRDDILQEIANAIDLACLHGTGSAQPTGIAGTSGIGTVLLATDGLSLANSTAYPAMVSLESTIATANADQGALAFLMRPGVRGQLRIAQRFTSTDSPVYKDGKVLDYRAEVSAQVSKNLTTGSATTITSPIFFGNWNDLLIANFAGGATDIVIDQFTLAVNGVVRVIARKWVDVGVRKPASFCLLGGVLNA